MTVDDALTRLKAEGPSGFAGRQVALPCLPKVAALLVAETGRDQLDLRRLHQLVSADPVLGLRVLTTANGPEFQLSGQISGISEALAVMGAEHVRQLASEATRASLIRKVAGLELHTFWRYSHNVAKLCRSFAGMLRLDATAAYTAGLIHGVGLLVMLQTEAEALGMMGRRFAPLDMKRAKAEHRALGFTFTQVSAQMARAGKLPDAVVTALHHEHSPFDNEAYEPLAGVLHLAAWRARSREAGLTDRELAVSFPDVVGLALGLDIDMVLQQEGIDWNSGSTNSASLGLMV